MTNKYSLKEQLLNEGPRFEGGRARRQYVKMRLTLKLLHITVVLKQIVFNWQKICIN